MRTIRDTSLGLRSCPGLRGGRDRRGFPVSSCRVGCTISNCSCRPSTARQRSSSAPLSNAGMTRCAVSAVSVVLIAQMCRSCTARRRAGREIGSTASPVDPLRHGVERQVQRIAQQAPGADDDHRDDDDAHHRVDPPPAGRRMTTPATTTPSETTASAAMCRKAPRMFRSPLRPAMKAAPSRR